MELRERAQAARMSLGSYLRRRALGQRVRIAAERRLGSAELRELNRIGVDLNQMARAMNSGAAVPAATQEAVERVGELVARLLAATAEAGPELKRLAGVAATGRKLEKPVCHYSLNWAKDERPDRQEIEPRSFRRVVGRSAAGRSGTMALAVRPASALFADLPPESRQTTTSPNIG